jgi:hypothetical protein
MGVLVHYGGIKIMAIIHGVSCVHEVVNHIGLLHSYRVIKSERPPERFSHLKCINISRGKIQ